MNMKINKACIIGSGVMGCGIAAQFANAGVPCLMLDIVPKEHLSSSNQNERNTIANESLKKALKLKPAPFF